MMAMQIDLPYLVEDWDRHGTGRIYVRYGGKKIRIRAEPGSDEFHLAYRTALAELQGIEKPRLEGAAAGTMGWMAACYFASTEFKGLATASQATRRNLIEDCLREPRRPGSPDVIRDCPISIFSAQHVKMLRDRKAATPAAANNRKKYLSAWFAWAVEHDLMTVNPARDVRKVRYVSAGFHPWTVDEVRQFWAKHKIGTKARLAIDLLLFLGVRRGDVVTLGKQHVKESCIRFVPNKTKHKRPAPTEKPILPILTRTIEGSKDVAGALTFIETAYGKPFSPAGFTAWFGDRCKEAGLLHCTPHGLRKAGATIAANAGATDRQLMALYDWSSAQIASIYTKEADKKKLTMVAAQMIADHMENEPVSHPLSHQTLKAAND